MRGGDVRVGPIAADPHDVALEHGAFRSTRSDRMVVL